MKKTKSYFRPTKLMFRHMFLKGLILVYDVTKYLMVLLKAIADYENMF